MRDIQSDRQGLSHHIYSHQYHRFSFLILLLLFNLRRARPN